MSSNIYRYARVYVLVHFKFKYNRSLGKWLEIDLCALHFGASANASVCVDMDVNVSASSSFIHVCIDCCECFMFILCVYFSQYRRHWLLDPFDNFHICLFVCHKAAFHIFAIFSWRSFFYFENRLDYYIDYCWYTITATFVGYFPTPHPFSSR